MKSPFFGHEFYLSPNGNDRWSGKSAEPTAQDENGPFASLDGARIALRQLKQSGALNGPVVVWVRGGRYPMTAPVTFEPEDSWPITFANYQEETPIFDGGQLIAGWRTEQVNGQTAWVTDLPEVAAGRWYFRSLFVKQNPYQPAQRRWRARLPKVERDPAHRTFLWMEGVPGLDIASAQSTHFLIGQDQFIAAQGDFQNFHNLQDVDVVALHFWVDERMPVLAYDPTTRLVTSRKRSIFRLTDDYKDHFAKYYLDNVFEGLSEPGEWYLDRQAGKLYYLPMPGETMESTQVIAPRTIQFIKVRGDPEAGQWVEHLRFVGLGFEHADWTQPRAGWDDGDIQDDSPISADSIDYATTAQAALHVPGVISLRGARYCAFENCSIQHIGWYGVEIGRGCQSIHLEGCTLNDLGAGGVKITGSSASESRAGRTGNNVICDNTIADGGRVFHSAIGVLVRHAYSNKIHHNHIHDFCYSGISCGWVWGYAENIARDNHIEKNHIHHLGFGWLSDMGGIYTLGVQPGTVIAGNLIHDVESASYGGWAIYPDEGSSHLLIENNICFDTTEQAFHEHYGRENIVRNNIFAYGHKAVLTLSRADAHRSFTFSKNILITDDQPVYTGGYGADLRKHPFGSDLNLFWSSAGKPITFLATGTGEDSIPLTWEEWQKLGYDRHSIIADPGFVDVAARNFTLKADSPVFALGFTPINMSDVGPRPAEARK